MAAPLAALGLAWDARAEPPTLSRAEPSALAPGVEQSVQIHGSELAGASGLWTSFPAEVEPLEEEGGAERAGFNVRVPEGTAVQIGAVRAVTEAGLTPPLLLMVDDLPTRRAASRRRSPQQAMPLQPPVAVDGWCARERSDFYRVEVEAGQSLSLEVVAQRLGSPLDPVLRVLDGRGRLVAYSDGEAGIGADARLRHTFEEAGSYLIEVRDLEHDGGRNHRYRLRAGDFPLFAAVFPPAARAGGSHRVRFAGPAAEGIEPIEVRIPAGAEGQWPLSAPFPGGRGSGFARLSISGLPERVAEGGAGEQESDSGAEPATVPAGISGRFVEAGSVHSHPLRLEAGQRIRVRDRSRLLGSPATLYLELRDEEGGSVARTAEPGHPDAGFAWEAEEAGIYELRVEQLHGRYGPAHIYRLEVERDPGFRLDAHAHTLRVPAGGSVTLRITCERAGYDGPVRLDLVMEGAGPPLQLAGRTLEREAEEVQMQITVPRSVAPGRWFTFRVQGTPLDRTDAEPVEAETLPALRELWPALAHPPEALNGRIVLSVVGEAEAPEEENGDG